MTAFPTRQDGVENHDKPLNMKSLRAGVVEPQITIKGYFLVEPRLNFYISCNFEGQSELSDGYGIRAQK